MSRSYTHHCVPVCYNNDYKKFSFGSHDEIFCKKFAELFEKIQRDFLSKYSVLQVFHNYMLFRSYNNVLKRVDRKCFFTFASGTKNFSSGDIRYLRINGRRKRYLFMDGGIEKRKEMERQKRKWKDRRGNR